MVTFSGAAAPLPTAAPAEPSTDTWAAILVDGRGPSALKRNTMRPPSPCTGSSELATTSSWAPPERASTLRLPAGAGAELVDGGETAGWTLGGGADSFSELVVAEYGAVRVRDSVPYQNSVLSLAARGCMRMIRGVIERTTSSFSTSV